MWVQRVPGGGVNHIAFSLDGRFLYTLDTGGGLTVWDVASHQGRKANVEHLRRKVARQGIYPLPDGRLLIRTDRFSILDPDGNVTTHPAPPGLGMHEYVQVLSSGRTYYGTPWRWTILGCDLGAETAKTAFTLPDALHPATIDRFDWSPDGRSLAVLFSGETRILLFEQVATDAQAVVPVAGFPPRAYRVKFSPDGRTLVVFSNTPDRLTLWDVASRSVRVGGIECSMPRGLFAFNPVYPLFAACQADGTLAIWSLDDGRVVRSLDFALGRAVRCVAFAPDGLTCAVGGTNKQFAVFDVDV